MEPNAQVPSRMGRKRDRADSEAETEEGKRRREDGLSPGEAVHTDGGDRSPKKRETRQQQELFLTVHPHCRDGSGARRTPALGRLHHPFLPPLPRRRRTAH